MRITILSCGIFQPELDILIPKMKQELPNIDIAVLYLSPGLHNTPAQMEEELIQHLDAMQSQKVVVLYGSMCHTELSRILHSYPIVFPTEKNCIEVMLKPEIKAEMDKDGSLIYLTAGWLKSWREMSPQKGTLIADKIIYLDCGENLVSDEEILEYYDFVNLPIETLPTTLDNFKNTVMTLLEKVLH